MAGNAAQVDQEVVLGEASILQVPHHQSLNIVRSCSYAKVYLNHLMSRDQPCSQ
jgi:hypothetical protein